MIGVPAHIWAGHRKGYFPSVLTMAKPTNEPCAGSQFYEASKTFNTQRVCWSRDVRCVFEIYRKTLIRASICRIQSWSSVPNKSWSSQQRKEPNIEALAGGDVSLVTHGHQISPSQPGPFPGRERPPQPETSQYRPFVGHRDGTPVESTLSESSGGHCGCIQTLACFCVNDRVLMIYNIHICLDLWNETRRHWQSSRDVDLRRHCSVILLWSCYARHVFFAEVHRPDLPQLRWYPILLTRSKT